MKKLLFTLFIVFSSQLNAALLEVNGVFKGENLFLRNSFNDSTQSSCITSVYLNGRDLKVDTKHLTLELDLRKFLSKGDAVNLRIYHKRECTPEIMNVGAIKRQSLFAFTKFTVDEKEYHWATRGEQKGSQFIVQRFLNGSWKDVKEFDSKGSMSGFSYSFPTLHYSGISRYRMKYIQLDGFVEYSNRIDFRSKRSPVSFYPTKVKGKITFVNNNKRPVSYEIYDIEGHKIASGSSLVIDCTKLEPRKVFTLVFDNQHRKFQKLKSSK
jgi:hypothetical protein